MDPGKKIKESGVCNNPECGYESILDDILIVRKIKPTHGSTNLKPFSQSYSTQIYTDDIEQLKNDEDFCTKKYDEIIQKKLRIIRADERGKQALMNELAAHKEQEQKKSDAFLYRQKALEVEKARAKQIASRPPPLPKSIQIMIREFEKKDKNTQYEDEENSPSNPEPKEKVCESDKENMIDEKFEKEYQQLQVARNQRAQKRFKEALKREREEKESADILKQIENAEKSNRRQLVKNMSEKRGCLPCTSADVFLRVEKQSHLEEAVEKVFKKKNISKEHAIEDLEGYEDKWEAKYKQIDSQFSFKLVDCVPSFVKDNYSYLLEEEPPSNYRRIRFSTLDDDDLLNVGFVESPTDTHRHSQELAEIINHLDEMRAETDEVYGKQFKPFLEAKEIPLQDKAVEANILRIPTEHKEVSAEISLPSASRFPDDHLKDIDDSKLSDLSSVFQSYKSRTQQYLPSLLSSTSIINGVQESMSSSSYYSLPSKHGLPNICCAPSCQIPLSENTKAHIDCIPLSKEESVVFKPPFRKMSELFNVPESAKEKVSADDREFQNSKSEKIRHDSKNASDDESRFSVYVKLLADKYLKNFPTNEKTESGGSGTTEKVSSINVQKDHDSSTVPSPETLTDVLSFSRTATFPSKPEIENSYKTVPVMPLIDKSSADSSGSKHALPLTEIFQPNEFQFPDETLMEKCYDLIASNVLNVFSPQNSSEDDTGGQQLPVNSGQRDSPLDYTYHELSLTNVEGNSQTSLFQ